MDLRQNILFVIIIVMILLIASSYDTCDTLEAENDRLRKYISDTLSDDYIKNKGYLTSDVLKSVNHLTLDADKFERIYVDNVEDIAYYRYIGKRKMLKAGAKVRTKEGFQTKVLDVTSAGFVIKATKHFHLGMSGTPIFDSKGNIVGYISLMLEGKVYCIWR